MAKKIDRFTTGMTLLEKKGQGFDNSTIGKAQDAPLSVPR